MKVFLSTGFILLSLTCFSQDIPKSGNSDELITNGLKLYNLEKALIIYDVEGQPNDTLVVLFDRYGWRQVTMEYGEKLYYGLKTKINTKEIIDGEIIFSMNLKEKTGKVKTDFTLPKLASYKSPNELQESKMAKLRATKIGLETMLDKECEVWTYEARGKPYKLWSWNGLYLKHISPTGTRTALEINLTPNIDENVFVPPQDVTLTLE